MSAGISAMYKRSGGCTREEICGRCGYYEEEEERGLVTERCRLHEAVYGEEHVWNGNWMACKHYEERARGKATKRKRKRAGSDKR